MKEEVKPLNKEERYVCRLIWGGMPLDVAWVRTTKVFNDAAERFKNDKEWQELYKDMSILFNKYGTNK